MPKLPSTCVDICNICSCLHVEELPQVACYHEDTTCLGWDHGSGDCHGFHWAKLPRL